MFPSHDTFPPLTTIDDDSYVLDDGRTIVVKGGKVESISEADSTQEDAKTEAPETSAQTESTEDEKGSEIILFLKSRFFSAVKLISSLFLVLETSCKTSLMHLAMIFISFSFIPRLVIPGVPNLIPDG